MQAPHWWLKRNGIARFLWPASIAFAGIVKCRQFLYKHKLLPVYQANLPIIVVGNISVGGTGKTPLVIAIVQWLQQQGHTPAVISRGYRAKPPCYPFWVTADTAATVAGDEPVLIAKHAQCPVVIAPKRVQAVQAIEQAGKYSVIIADDGLQHYSLQRDIEIIVIDAERQFGNGFLLPAGMLREPIKRCQQADLLVYNGEGPAQGIGSYAYNMQLAVKTVYNLQQPTVHYSLQQFQGQTVHAVAGIGNPQRFFKLLANAGINIIEHAFPDHHHYIAADFMFANDGLPILLTEKDAVKCTTLAKSAMFCVAVEAALSSEFFQQLSILMEKYTKNA
jgi:tetraacyldisaccharide 4'-kinase